jgi:cyclophilin family peptidyl-prolyl cis-trans isomerase
VPSAKRARQRAGRDARRAALAKQQQRRKTVRRAITIAIVAIVVVGSVYLITRPKSPTAAASPTTSQAAANAVAVKAGCPASTTKRVNTLKFAAPPMTIDTTKTYTANVKTTVGTFVISLDAETSPVAVNSFVFLAKHDFFHCVIFHRVIPGFVDQTGDPTGTGTGGPGYQFTEAGPTKASPQYPLGAVAMANSDSPATTTPKTNGSQWFVVAGTQGEALPPDYVLFGRVISGLNVVAAINKDGSTSGVPPKITQRILSVTIHEL